MRKTKLQGEFDASNRMCYYVSIFIMNIYPVHFSGISGWKGEQQDNGRVIAGWPSTDDGVVYPLPEMKVNVHDHAD
jgi:hypothetical protein